MTTMLESESSALSESDQHLIFLVRGGDTAAYGRLYERHVAAARRLARALARDPSDVDDLVAETFVRVLAALRAGRGPDTAFRAYVLTTLRHTLYDRGKRDRRIEYTDDLTAYEKPVAAEDPLVRELESSYAARAFARLPERWRAVLWHTEVEGESAAQIAPLFGLTPNGVAALAYRARERLRQMYLQEHITLTDSPQCHWAGSHLAGYVRGGLARRDRSKVDDHLAGCVPCRVLHRELSEENAGFRGVLAVLVLGSAGPAYLAQTAATGAAWLPALGALLIGWWQAITSWAGNLLDLAVNSWHRLLGLPRWLAERYGFGNVAAASGLVTVGLAGVVTFTLVLQTGQTPPRAALPVPAPAPPSRVLPIPTDAARLTPPTLSLAPPSLAPIVPKPTPARPIAMPSAATTSPPRPAIDFLPASSTLAAGQTGNLPITVRLAESARLTERSEPGGISLQVKLPDGVALAGPDAGSGWVCAAADALVTCDHAGRVGGGRSVARIPLAVAAGVSGYQGFGVTAVYGTHRDTRTVRAPIAPAGLRVAYAATGRVGFAVAGNALLACQPRPACLNGDNNLQLMLPALPAEREPAAPRGLLASGGPTGPAGQLIDLAGAKAASGARVAIPRGATVQWAGLSLASSAGAAPGIAGVSGPRGGWYPINVVNGVADVTDLVRQQGDGDWWVATRAADLPGGLGHYAGWSLVVVHETPSVPGGELAVYGGPQRLEFDQELRVDLGTGPVDLGLVLWDGDARLSGDTLVVGGQSVGDPANIAAGHNSSSVTCNSAPVGCPWPTLGLDVLRHKGSSPGEGELTLRSGRDPLEIGSLTVLTETAQANG